MSGNGKTQAPSEPEDTAPHYHGHRERLRQRFRDAGSEAVTDYELLELVLFRALPRRDLKPLAKQLLATFGSFAEVLRRRVNGSPRSKAWATPRSPISRSSTPPPTASLRGQVKQRPVLSSWSNVLDYCRTAMAFENKEQFRVLFLDKRNALIADEVQQTGTVDHTPVYPREVVKRALELSATAIVLVHNHPSGDPTPSRADIQMTQAIVEVARAARHRRARPPHRRQRRPREPQGAEAYLTRRMFQSAHRVRTADQPTIIGKLEPPSYRAA